MATLTKENLRQWLTVQRFSPHSWWEAWRHADTCARGSWESCIWIHRQQEKNESYARPGFNFFQQGHISPWCYSGPIFIKTTTGVNYHMGVWELNWLSTRTSDLNHFSLSSPIFLSFKVKREMRIWIPCTHWFLNHPTENSVASQPHILHTYVSMV